MGQFGPEFTDMEKYGFMNLKLYFWAFSEPLNKKNFDGG
jgi:hypothetical protein